MIKIYAGVTVYFVGLAVGYQDQVAVALACLGFSLALILQGIRDIKVAKGE